MELRKLPTSMVVGFVVVHAHLPLQAHVGVVVLITVTDYRVRLGGCHPWGTLLQLCS
jgi:hypothetical protein